MSNYTNIAAIADEVLASVRETSVKTASDATAEHALKTVVGQNLKLAAAAIRNLRDDEVTDTDVTAMIVGARKYAATSKAAVWPFSSAPATPAATPEPTYGGYADDDAYARAYHDAIARAHRDRLSGFTMKHPDGTQDEYDPDGTALNLVAPKTAAHTRVIRNAGVSTQLRKIAADIRVSGSVADADRAVKTAKMITAAVGIEHLTKTLKAST